MGIRHRSAFLATLLALSLLAVSSTAWSHHDETADDGTKQRNKHLLHPSDSEGHIAKNVNYGLEPIGQIAPGGVAEGRYTDVWADGRYAYVGTFHEPSCDRNGVYVADISDPANPTYVNHIQSPPDTRVNDVKTIRLDNRNFKGTVLIHSLEPCGASIPGFGENPSSNGQGGISLWDVTDPAQPSALRSRFLDFGVHNVYPWTVGKSAYVILVDDDHALDVHVVDITKPQSPKLLSTTGLPQWPGAQDDQAAGMGAFGASFNHDVWVKEIGGRQIALVSYWDAGWVKLDVTDPANPVFLDDSTYPDPDPITGISPPEGNAHAGAFNSTGDLIFAGDEDFDPYRVIATITSGTFDGTTFNASQGSDVPQIDSDTSLVGASYYVGLACDSSTAVPPAASADAIAVVQRGGCTFTEKATNVQAAGYQGGIVFNSESGSPPCEAMVSMLVSADIPFLFVARSTGFEILGIAGYNPDNCPSGDNPALPAVGTAGSSLDIHAVFDGWAYFHLLDTASLAERGYYAPGELFDETYAQGFGDLSMHNVEADLADPSRAFIAWYSAGMRAVEVQQKRFRVSPPKRGGLSAATPGVDDYYGSQVKEVGRFIAPEGSNFWGVHVHELDGQQYVLGSDRNTGIWIFKFNPSYCDPTCPAS